MEVGCDVALVYVGDDGFQCELYDKSAGVDICCMPQALNSEQRQDVAALEQEFKDFIKHSVEFAMKIKGQLEFNMLIAERGEDESAYRY